MTPLFRKFLGMNWVLVLTMIGLLIFGVYSIWSATHMREELALSTAWDKQVKWIAIGLIVFFGTSLVDYKWVKWGAVPFFILGLGLLILVLFKGEEFHGHKNTLRFGSFGFQPSQLAIAAGILTLALVLSHLGRLGGFFRHPMVRLLVTGIVAGVPCLLVLVGADFGSAFVWLPVVAGMLLVGRIPFRYLAAILLLALTIAPWAYYVGLKDYQKLRILVFMGVVDDIKDSGWALRNSMIAIGSAGWEGKGESRETLNHMGFIPKTTAMNDYIFTVMSEKLGFRGGVFIIAAFALLLMLCMYVAFYSRDQLGRLLVVGIIALLFGHVMLNIGGNIQVLPLTGLPLPMVSYGGTFVVAVMFLMGIVQSVWVHRDETLLPATERQDAGI